MFLKAFVGVEEPQTELMLYQMKLAPELRYFSYETARFKFQFVLYHLYTNRPV